jgi:hypothetical protein
VAGALISCCLFALQKAKPVPGDTHGNGSVEYPDTAMRIPSKWVALNRDHAALVGSDVHFHRGLYSVCR